MFSFLATVSLLSLSISLAAAMDVCASTLLSCGATGLFSCCTNLANNVCCRGWPANFGFGVDFLNPPANTLWIGEAFADNACLNFETSGGSSAPSTCISVCSTCTASKSAGWLIESLADEAASNVSARDAASMSECVQPDTVRFVDASGEQREVKIPDRAFDKVHELLSARNFDALLNL